MENTMGGPQEHDADYHPALADESASPALIQDPVLQVLGPPPVLPAAPPPVLPAPPPQHRPDLAHWARQQAEAFDQHRRQQPVQPPGPVRPEPPRHWPARDLEAAAPHLQRVDAGEGRVRLMGAIDAQAAREDAAAGVHPFADRRPYEMSISNIVSRPDGTPLDTARIKLRYFQMLAADQMAVPRGFAGRGGNWALRGMIWVCAPDPVSHDARFYTSVCLNRRVHHSSLVEPGGGVIGAGEWIVEDGHLVAISAASGHFKPTIDMLYRAVLHLAVAFNDRTTVLLFDTQARQWVDLPVGRFIQAPTQGGRLQVADVPVRAR
jgi:hypothetical protein